MTIEEMNRIKGFDSADVWEPEYDPGYVSDEENEEITQILESLTEDDLKTAMIVERKLNDPSYRKIIYKDEDFFRELRDEEIRKV
ncbi:MAG: hypothetical protein IJU26_05845 [Synergistaceae bacterium]|nr:hypothetical protein [Synergistaceae bacterium]